MTMTHTTPVRRIDLRPVTRETLSAQIRDQLLRRILDGQLEPGARVPSERDLSDRFGVARTSVRGSLSSSERPLYLRSTSRPSGGISIQMLGIEPLVKSSSAAAARLPPTSPS